MKADTLRIFPSTSVSRVTIQLVDINSRVNSSLCWRHDAANFSPETLRTRKGDGRVLSTFDDMLHLLTFDDISTKPLFVDKVDPMKINSMRDVAAAVRGRRQELGLSQADLAARVGVSRSWINKVEAGKPSVEFDLVLRLFDFLDFRLDLAKNGNFGGVFKGRSIDLDSVLEKYRG